MQHLCNSGRWSRPSIPVDKEVGKDCVGRWQGPALWSLTHLELSPCCVTSDKFPDPSKHEFCVLLGGDDHSWRVILRVNWPQHAS